MGDHFGHEGHDHHAGHTSNPPVATTHGSQLSEGHVHQMQHMKSFFHTDYGDTLLFQSWMLDNSWQTIIACLGMLILATLYEGLKCFREYLLKRSKSSPCYPVSIVNIQTRGINENGDTAAFANRRAQHSKMFNSMHLVQSVLHMLQVALSYTLMLGFMTFNVWLCLSILIGAGIGYFLFCWRKITIVDVTEHCH
ncbi:high affinity copper uptake protein 1-like isoform X3 [Leptotrombidium deliense]|uniref:Copper transport protein n=1 Tax=Leptotrombidium deliense TaxID=299467 RepID=A0A443SJ39_9ACAR|nr:high affinity copper uptake protein 1-like isoform X3 [Leptotrombidium deliense]